MVEGRPSVLPFAVISHRGRRRKVVALAVSTEFGFFMVIEGTIQDLIFMTDGLSRIYSLADSSRALRNFDKSRTLMKLY